MNDINGHPRDGVPDQSDRQRIVSLNSNSKSVLRNFWKFKCQTDVHAWLEKLKQKGYL